ncbi:MAG: hypothetical protein JST21_16165 [Bacteroidetes bacterium]|nr:hypothetical protein [Bacteroidota bacterium]
MFRMKWLREDILREKNLPELIKIVDRWRIYENAPLPPEEIAKGEREAAIKIIDLALWEKLK